MSLVSIVAGCEVKGEVITMSGSVQGRVGRKPQPIAPASPQAPHLCVALCQRTQYSRMGMDAACSTRPPEPSRSPPLPAAVACSAVAAAAAAVVLAAVVVAAVAACTAEGDTSAAGAGAAVLAGLGSMVAQNNGQQGGCNRPELLQKVGELCTSFTAQRSFRKKRRLLGPTRCRSHEPHNSRNKLTQRTWRLWRSARISCSCSW